MLPKYISNSVNAVKNYSTQLATAGLFAVVMVACSGVEAKPTNIPTTAPTNRASPTDAVTHEPIETPTPYAINTITPESTHITTEMPTPVADPTPTLEPILEQNPSKTPDKTSYVIPECKIHYQDVKSGLISPQIYIQDLEQCLSEAVQAKEDGMLKGFLYNPTETQLENLLTDLFSDYIMEEQFLQYMVQSSIDGYNSLSGDEAGTLVPSVIAIFGQEVPIYIAFNDELIASTMINNDADVQSIGIHELKHIEDWYNGITLDDIHLSFNTISPETFRIDFLKQLLELRAVYTELEEAFRETVETGDFSISPQWFGSQASNYNKHWKFLENYDTTDLEKKVREQQFEQFKGIVPEEANDGFLIKFDLFENQRTALITPNQQ